MSKIHIVTDSASDIPVNTAKKLGVEILPVLITFENKTIREFYDITPAEYNKILLNLDEIPKTAQITLESFTKCFKNAKDNGYTDLVYISINSNGSGTYNTSMIARDLFYEGYGTGLNIHLIDSKTYSYLYGSVVCSMAKMRNEGKSIEEIVAFANETLPKNEAFLAVFELKHLKKSGRISGGAAFIGEALGLKPISVVKDGTVIVCDKARGEANLIKKLVSNVKSSCKNPEKQTGYIAYGIVEDTYLEALENMLLNEVGFKNVELVPLGAAITTNAGPKSLGVFYQK